MLLNYIDRQTGHTDRETDTQTDRERDRHIDRQRERQHDRDRHNVTQADTTKILFSHFQPNPIIVHIDTQKLSQYSRRVILTCFAYRPPPLSYM